MAGHAEAMDVRILRLCDVLAEHGRRA
jgi:hypothetical protein